MTVEVAPAVVTAVSTTVISFLPVFFLTGRDYRLFAPLAWTKTFAIVASLIVAVLLVPPLARLLLKNPKFKGWTATFAAIIFGGIVAALLTFVWQTQIADLAAWLSTKLNLQTSPLAMTVSFSMLATILVYGIY
jgi:Cu(I)/Ag(I) efflux system membrane protein CusA/SilA